MQSRRDVLRMGAGVTGAGLLTGLAGCSDAPIVGESGFDYTDWVYDPESLDSDRVWFSQSDIEAILDADGIPDDDREALRDDLAEEYDDALSADDIELSSCSERIPPFTAFARPQVLRAHQKS